MKYQQIVALFLGTTQAVLLVDEKHETEKVHALEPIAAHIASFLDFPSQRTAFYVQTNQEKLEQLIQLQADPVENHCTNPSKATGEDQDCSAPGNSAWTTFNTSRTGKPADAQSPPYPGHTLH